ncbi:lasso RiPP family leader peptide-containing protein [Candidatus Cyanaurora vandensis]|nr:lasso RiPP family leader peptide-containing protein [Candidatus Cyanaurora vandensis]
MDGCKKPYITPRVTRLGSLANLTQAMNTGTMADGSLSMNGVPLIS